MGLLDGFGDFIKTPEGQGLLATVFGGLAGAQKGAPLNSLGRAGMSGIMGYGNALDRQTQQAEAVQMGKYRDMQMARSQMDMDAAKSELMKREQLQAAIAANRIPAKPANAGGLPTVVDSALPPEFQTGVKVGAMEAQPASFNREGFGQAWEGIDPIAGFNYQQSLQKDDAPVKLGAGEQLFSGKASGYKPLLSVPVKDAVLPASIQEYKFAKDQGYPGTYEQWDTARKRAGASSVSLTNVGPKAFEGELGKLDAEQLNKWRGGAETAQSTLQTVQNLRSAEKSGAYSGGTANMRMAVGNFINGITGATPKGFVGSQQYTADASKLVLDRIKSLGANPSNADREFIEKTVPQLSTSAEARAAMTDFLEKQATQAIDLYRRADSHARKNSGLGGFNALPATQSGDIDALVNKYR